MAGGGPEKSALSVLLDNVPAGEVPRSELAGDWDSGRADHGTRRTSGIAVRLHDKASLRSDWSRKRRSDRDSNRGEARTCGTVRVVRGRGSRVLLQLRRNLRFPRRPVDLHDRAGGMDLDRKELRPGAGNRHHTKVADCSGVLEP